MVLEEGLLRLHGAGIELAESVFSSGNAGTRREGIDQPGALLVLPRGGPGPSYDHQLHQPRLWPGFLARCGSGPTRGFHCFHGLKAVHCWPLDLDGHAGG